MPLGTLGQAGVRVGDSLWEGSDKFLLVALRAARAAEAAVGLGNNRGAVPTTTEFNNTR